MAKNYLEMPQNTNIVLFSIFSFAQCWFIFILMWITKHIISWVNIALKSRKFVQFTSICSCLVVSFILCLIWQSKVFHTQLKTQILSFFALTKLWWWNKVQCFPAETPEKEFCKPWICHWDILKCPPGSEPIQVWNIILFSPQLSVEIKVID